MDTVDIKPSIIKPKYINNKVTKNDEVLKLSKSKVFQQQTFMTTIYIENPSYSF